MSFSISTHSMMMLPLEFNDSDIFGLVVLDNILLKWMFMNFTLIHQTRYDFSSEVFLEPHYLRFRPKPSPHASVLDVAIVLSPEPEGHKVIEDQEGNIIDFCWFESVTSSLSISVESKVKIANYNPFDFIIYPDTYGKVPFSYDKQLLQSLAPFLEHSPVTKALVDYVAQISSEAGHDTISFISKLTSQIHRDFSVEYRESGAPLSPTETFQSKKGSCRDLSWMLINVLRNVGIASRFVSGYYYFEVDKPAYELHAWVEVFLPSTGWLGFDPSHGIATGNTHFALASSAFADNTMPVTGGIRGSATSTLSTQLHIEKNKT